MSALQKQEGGNHYKDLKIQPVEYIHANQLGFIEGSVVKYVTRHKQKNGREDIVKAIHFLELLLQLEYDSKRGYNNPHEGVVKGAKTDRICQRCKQGIPESDNAVQDVGGLICGPCIRKEQNPPYTAEQVWPSKE